MINLNEYDITFVKADGVVCLNGDCIHGFDLTASMPSDVTFVHWYGSKGYAELQHEKDENGITPPNTRVTSVDEYLPIIEEWFAKDGIRKQNQVCSLEEVQQHTSTFRFCFAAFRCLSISCLCW